jgi:hypothetical protein
MSLYNYVATPTDGKHPDLGIETLENLSASPFDHLRRRSYRQTYDMRTHLFSQCRSSAHGCVHLKLALIVKNILRGHICNRLA